jgi:hypothetical protein
MGEGETPSIEDQSTWHKPEEGDERGGSGATIDLPRAKDGGGNEADDVYAAPEAPAGVGEESKI